MSYWNYRVFEKVLNKYEHDTSYEGLCGEDGIVRIGYLYGDYHGNGCTTHYFKSNGVMYLAENSLYLEVEVED